MLNMVSFNKFRCNIVKISLQATPIKLLYDVLKEDTNEATKLAIINDFDKVLSLDLTKGAIEEKKEENIDSELETYINEMIAKRAEAKKNKDFATADSIRDELASKGIILKDTREGTTYHIEK